MIYMEVVGHVFAGIVGVKMLVWVAVNRVSPLMPWAEKNIVGTCNLDFRRHIPAYSLPMLARLLADRRAGPHSHDRLVRLVMIICPFHLGNDLWLPIARLLGGDSSGLSPVLRLPVRRDTSSTEMPIRVWRRLRSRGCHRSWISVYSLRPT